MQYFWESCKQLLAGNPYQEDMPLLAPLYGLHIYWGFLLGTNPKVIVVLQAPPPSPAESKVLCCRWEEPTLTKDVKDWPAGPVRAEP